MSLPVAVYQGRDGVTPGLWTMSTKQYHEGPAPAPELSSSVLQALLAGSPLHAWACSSRLNPSCEREDARRMEIGSVAHKLVLDAGSDIVVLDFDSYRKKAAQEARDETTAAGKIPVLAADFIRAEALAGGMRNAVEAYLGMSVVDCLREVVVLWKDTRTGCWRKAMLDICTPDLLRFVDLKTTEASVAPAVCARRIYEGYQVQAAHYRNGLDALHKDGRGRRQFAFIFAETAQPFAVSPPIELSEGGWMIAQQQVEVGSALWDSCLLADNWPGFDQDPHVAEPPPWMMQSWAMRMEGDRSLNPLAGAPPGDPTRYANV